MKILLLAQRFLMYEGEDIHLCTNFNGLTKLHPYPQIILIAILMMKINEDFMWTLKGITSTSYKRAQTNLSSSNRISS